MSEDSIDKFIELVNTKGIALTSTKDGYVILLKRERLQSMLVGSLGSLVKIGITDTDGGVAKHISLSRDTLQNKLDANPDQQMFMIMYTFEPLKN